MNSALLVITFPRAEDAAHAHTTLGMLSGHEMSALDHTVVISRRNHDRPTLEWQGQLPIHLEQPTAWLPCLFANVLFCGDCTETQRRLTESGLDEHFMNELQTALGPDTSALLMYAPANRREQLERIAALLTLLRGKLHHTTFPALVEARLLHTTWTAGVPVQTS